MILYVCVCVYTFKLRNNKKKNRYIIDSLSYIRNKYNIVHDTLYEAPAESFRTKPRAIAYAKVSDATVGTVDVVYNNIYIEMKCRSEIIYYSTVRFAF